MAYQNNKKKRNFKRAPLTEFRNPIDMQKNAPKIFREIAFGNFEEKDLVVFTNPQFIANALKVAMDKQFFHNTHYTATAQVYGGSADPNIFAVLDYDKKCLDAYNIIIQHLTIIRDSGDVRYVGIMANALKPLRFNI